jgi:hypothetical protein
MYFDYANLAFDGEVNVGVLLRSHDGCVYVFLSSLNLVYIKPGTYGFQCYV